MIISKNVIMVALKFFVKYSGSFYTAEQLPYYKICIIAGLEWDEFYH